jgi:hypothetical protein
VLEVAGDIEGLWFRVLAASYGVERWHLREGGVAGLLAGGRS